MRDYEVGQDPEMLGKLRGMFEEVGKLGPSTEEGSGKDVLRGESFDWLEGRTREGFERREIGSLGEVAAWSVKDLASMVVTGGKQLAGLARDVANGSMLGEMLRNAAQTVEEAGKAQGVWRKGEAASEEEMAWLREYSGNVSMAAADSMVGGVAEKGVVLGSGGSKVPWVWSALERALETGFKGVKEMKAGSVLNRLKKMGVKDAELEWTGMDQVLGTHPERVYTLSEVKELAEKKGIKTEVKKFTRDFNPEYDDKLLRLESMGYRVEEEYGEVGLVNAAGDFLAHDEIPHEVRRLFNEVMQSGGEPRHESMFVNRPLPKGEGYRESLVTLKHEGKPMQLPEHYDPDNVVVGMLADVRKTSEGAKALHLQEGQSDWARKGREFGWADPTKEAFYEKGLEKLRTAYRKPMSIDEMADYIVRGKPAPSLEKKRAAMEILNKKLTALKEAPPPMPFKGDEALKLGLKRMLWEASEEGAEKLTWTRGKDIAERWSLRQAADKLTYKDGILRAHKNEAPSMLPVETFRQEVTPKDLTRYLTKEQAATLLEEGVLKGEGLALGKRWPYEVYDKKIPAMLKKLTREVGEEVVPRLEGVSFPKETGKIGKTGFDALNAADRPGQLLGYRYSVTTPEGNMEYFKTIEEATALIKKLYPPGKTEFPVHSLDLPASLRKKIKEKGFRLLEGDADTALGLKLARELNEQASGHGVKFDGAWEGFGTRPGLLQFTPQEGKLKGRTFSVPLEKELGVEALVKKLKEML